MEILIIMLVGAIPSFAVSFHFHEHIVKKLYARTYAKSKFKYLLSHYVMLLISFLTGPTLAIMSYSVHRTMNQTLPKANKMDFIDYLLIILVISWFIFLNMLIQLNKG